MYQKFLIAYLISINVYTFILCYIDKLRSIKKKYRIKESTLILISILGGCFGFVLGMHIFRHKTKKMKFNLLYLVCFGYVFLYLYLSHLL